MTTTAGATTAAVSGGDNRQVRRQQQRLPDMAVCDEGRWGGRAVEANTHEETFFDMGHMSQIFFHCCILVLLYYDR
jgi:hypothetical protein